VTQEESIVSLGSDGVKMDVICASMFHEHVHAVLYSDKVKAVAFLDIVIPEQPDRILIKVVFLVSETGFATMSIFVAKSELDLAASAQHATGLAIVYFDLDLVEKLLCWLFSSKGCDNQQTKCKKDLLCRHL